MESVFNLVTCSYVFGASSSAEKVSDTVWALKGWRWRPKRMRIVSLKISIRCHSENVQEGVSVKRGCVWGRWRLKNSLSRKSPCSFVSFVGKIFVTPFCAQPPSSPTPRQLLNLLQCPKIPLLLHLKLKLVQKTNIRTRESLTALRHVGPRLRWKT